jgi:hypothetical protein
MKRSIMIAMLGVALVLLSSAAWAAPITTPYLGATLSLNAGSVYNPRIYGEYNYATNLYATGIWGKWEAGSSEPEFTRPPVAGGSEHRMVGGFLGAESSTYLMATGGAYVPKNLLTRFDFADGANPVSVTCPVGEAVSSYAWTGTPNRMVYNLYKPTTSEIILADVTPNPFTVTAVTTGPWDGSRSMPEFGGAGPGAIPTSSNYIRAVTVGSTYNNYAFYGDGGTGSGGVAGATFKFWNINLDTGLETELGTFGPLQTVPPGGTYYNMIWTVVERGGYLYVQTTRGDADGNVVKIYHMTSPTTLELEGGAPKVIAAYTWSQLAAITGEPTYYLGFDVSPDGSRMLISGTLGKAFELTPLPGDANMDNVVDNKDASILGAHWLQASGASWYTGDFNFDGAVNDKDAAILAAHWSVAEGSVPEPSTLAMLFAAAVMAWFLRRSR